MIKKLVSLLRNKSARIFFKIYEPFVYSLCLSIVSCTFMIDYFSDGTFISQEDYDKRVFLMSLIGGRSIPTIIRIISYSSGLCKWYMANIACLLINNMSGFAYYFGWIGYIPYVFMATGLSCAGVMSFLVFRIFYRITDEVCLRRTDL